MLFVVNNYPPRVGGVELHVAALTRELVVLGHHATVLTLSETPSDVVEDGVRVIRIRQGRSIGGVFAFPHGGDYRRAVAGLSGSGVTAVSTQTRFFPMTWRGVAAGRALGVPVIHTEHGSDFVSGVAPHVALASRAVDVTFGRRALRRADVVLGVSERVVAFVRRLAGVDARTFYNAIESVPVDPADPPSRPVLVFVGRLVEGKGADRALEAFQRLAGTRDDARLVVLGDGPLRPALEVSASTLGIADRVDFRGRVAPATVMQELAGAVLVNPSTLSEGFQTTLIEAAASGGQIVTYPLAGVTALAEGGAPVHVVESRDPEALAAAMAEALDAPKPRWTMEEARRWTWERRAQEYLGVVAEVTS